MTMLRDVLAFHQKFNIPISSDPRLISEEDIHFRLNFLSEELHELAIAHGRGDLADFADSLVDLVYVTLGTALWAGLGDVWQHLWDEVQRANMSKVMTPSADASKRGHKLDIIKPPGWQAPRIKEILAARSPDYFKRG